MLSRVYRVLKIWETLEEEKLHEVPYSRQRKLGGGGGGGGAQLVLLAFLTWKVFEFISKQVNMVLNFHRIHKAY